MKFAHSMKFAHFPVIAALCALLIAFPVAGCNGQTVAQDIVNWTPALQSAVTTVDTAVGALDPASAVVLAAATVGFDAASNLLVAEAKAYLANPSASLLTQLQAAVTTFEQNVSAATLAAAKISNISSQQHALAAIGAVGTIVQSILALVSGISTKTALNRMAAESPLKLAEIEKYEDFHQKASIIADHYRETETVAMLDMTIAGARLQHAGF